MASFDARRVKVEAAVLQPGYSSEIQNERSNYEVQFSIKLGETLRKICGILEKHLEENG